MTTLSLEDLDFIERYCEGVIRKLPLKARWGISMPEFKEWLRENIGPRPSNNHFIYLTNSKETIAEWREITNWKRFYKEYLDATDFRGQTIKTYEPPSD